MIYQVLKSAAVRSDKILAVTGAALVVIALGMTGAFRAHAADAETLAANTTLTGDQVPVLPALHLIAAADTSTSDAAPAGFRAKMRERFQERVQERKKEFEKEHPPVDKKLTSDQVRDIVAGRLAMSGNPNLKVGKVSAKGDDIVAVEVVTKTGALVDTREISTKTGLPAGVEEHMKARRGGRFADGRGMGMRHRAITERHGDSKTGRDLALTTDQARKLAEARLIMMGNKNLKVGAVKEKDANTISVDIVASDNSLVVQRLIDRHTGRPIRNG